MANLSDEQLLIIKMSLNNELDEYKKVIDKLNSRENIYHIFVDRDWLYNNYILENFINNCELIYFKGDL